MQNHFNSVNQLQNDSSVFSFHDAADQLDFIQQCKHTMRVLYPGAAGDAVLDIGCGLGQELQRFSQTVGEEGLLVGVDLSESVIAEARNRVVQQGLNIDFQVGDAQQLKQADNQFNLCRAERVIEYVDDPVAMLREMVRVLKPGGSLLLFDFDYQTMIADADDPELNYKISQIVFRSVPSGGAAGQMLRHLTNLGMNSIKVIPQTFVLSFDVYEMMVRQATLSAMQQRQLSQFEYEHWWQTLSDAAAAGVFFASLSGFISYGVKPC
ncbi:MAG: hypothetical protein Tsb002_27440 [Wenzhouxiangellaceae bacterium]